MIKILYRAKRKDNGAWTEGYVFELQPGQYMICDRIQYDRASTLPAWEFFRYCSHEVIPETICRYIGLKDKSGNLIWENDIVSINTYSYEEPEEDYFGKVVYVEGWACWCIQQPDDEKPIPLCECEGSYQTDRFVEGNIFDNPELLKGDQSCMDL